MRFRSFFPLLIALAMASAIIRIHAQPAGSDPDAAVFESNRLLGRGVNVLGYDPIWRDSSKARFKERYFSMIKEAGFSSLRVNLAPFRAMTPGPNPQIAPDWWKTLDWILGGSQKAGLRVILDLHEFRSIGDDPDGNRARYLSFWTQLAQHCKDAPDTVYFELLNEPNNKMTPELWNRWLADALAIVRRSNPDRSVIVGPGNYNSIDLLPKLRLPAGDRHLIATVHYYTPMEFTHQGAKWMKYADRHDISWLGNASDQERIEHDFSKVAAWSQKEHRPVFLGEFGAYDQAPMDSRVRYVTSVARAAERHGWSWAYWQFDSDFVVYDIPHEHWVRPILDGLVPAKAAN